MHKASWTIAALTVFLTLTAAAQGRGQAPEPVRGETADQQGAAAGEAPPAPDQAARTPAPDPSSAAPQPAAKRGSRAALEHLARIEELVGEALGKTTKSERPSDPVGTTGTPMTEHTGERIPVERAKLEEIRMHLEQVRTALAVPPDGKQK